MRSTRAVSVAVGVILIGSVAADVIGYRAWSKRFERAAWTVVKSRSAWDGKPRSTSADPAAYSMIFGDKPTRFLKYGVKPVTALVFEPPWYVWSYHLCSSGATAWGRCEQVFGSEAARRVGLYRRVPCQIAFIESSVSADCAGSEIVPYGPPP